jgi:dipeptidyl aminopeptidase/acylaminoacyl peptidase
VRLNSTLPSAGSSVQSFAISPDSTFVVYRADEKVAGRFEVFRVPLAGGVSVQLSHVLVAGESIVSFVLSADASRTLYLVHDGHVSRLWSAPTDRSSAPVRLDAAPGFEGRIRRFQPSPDGERVALVADVETEFANQLFVVPSDASQPPLEVSVPGTRVSGGSQAVQFSPDGARIAFLASVTSPSYRLYSVRADGSAPAVTLYQPSTGNSVVGAPVDGLFLLTPDSARILFFARIASQTRLLSAPLDGSSAAHDLAPAGGQVLEGSARLTPDGTRVVYPRFTSSGRFFHSELVGAPRPRAISGSFSQTGALNESFLALDRTGDRALYVADQLVAGRLELFLGFLGRPVRASEPPQRSVTVTR